MGLLDTSFNPKVLTQIERRARWLDKQGADPLTLDKNFTFPDKLSIWLGLEPGCMRGIIGSGVMQATLIEPNYLPCVDGIIGGSEGAVKVACFEDLLTGDTRSLSLYAYLVENKFINFTHQSVGAVREAAREITQFFGKLREAGTTLAHRGYLKALHSQQIDLAHMAPIRMNILREGLRLYASKRQSGSDRIKKYIAATNVATGKPQLIHFNGCVDDNKLEAVLASALLAGPAGYPMMFAGQPLADCCYSNETLVDLAAAKGADMVFSPFSSRNIDNSFSDYEKSIMLDFLKCYNPDALALLEQTAKHSRFIAKKIQDTGNYYHRVGEQNGVPIIHEIPVSMIFSDEGSVIRTTETNKARLIEAYAYGYELGREALRAAGIKPPQERDPRETITKHFTNYKAGGIALAA